MSFSQDKGRRGIDVCRLNKAEAEQALFMSFRQDRGRTGIIYVF